MLCPEDQGADNDLLDVLVALPHVPFHLHGAVVGGGEVETGYLHALRLLGEYRAAGKTKID